MEDYESSDVRYLAATSTSRSQPVVTAPGIGKYRRIGGLNAIEWVFMVVSVVNILATMGLTTYRLAVVIQDKQTQTADFTLTILLLVNAAFCIYYVVHGLLLERKYELFAFVTAILVVVAYCSLEFFLNPRNLANKGSPTTIIKLVRLIAAWVLAPINGGLAIKVAIDFRWLEFRIVGASEALQIIYRQAAWFLCLLKFDLQVSFSLVVLALRDGTALGLPEIILLAVGIPYSLLWVLLGWFTVRYEKMSLVFVFSLLGLVTPAYVIYKIVRLYQVFMGGDGSVDAALNYITLAACALSILVRVIILCELYYVVRKFGCGLKERVLGKNPEVTPIDPPETYGDT